MATFLEHELADVIIAHTEVLLGEPLVLLERKLWMGRYELDLLFQDRHGAKLIVELQRGTLDRYHLYKVLDYYDEYKDRHPEQFVEVMVVANVISPERKARLDRRSINYREIPDETIRELLATKTVARSRDESISQSPDLTQPAAPAMPESFRKEIQSELETPFILGMHENSASKDRFLTLIYGLVSHIRSKRKAVHDDLRPVLPEHEALQMGGLDDTEFELAIQNITSELIPFLRVQRHSGPAQEYFKERDGLLRDLVTRTTRDPAFLLHLCSSICSLWSRAGSYLSYACSLMFLNKLVICLTSIVRETSLRLFNTRAVPIGVDEGNRFITRPVKLMSYDVPQIRSDFLFQHLSIALALPPNSIVPLWKEGENLYVKSVTGAFPLLENPFQVGTELLVNADDSKVYPISHPSEVILQTGELKSITLREHPSAGIIYKVRYQDDTISFGQVALKGTEKGDREVEYFSTNMIIDILGANFDLIEDDGRITAINAGGGEFALVSAITRDFFVCEEEEKERYYSPERQPKNTSKHKSGMIVRYLPRFRIRYIGIRENDYSKERRSVLGHQVSGHLRRCRSASPLQLILADQFNVPVPDGFTFVKPHERRGYDQVLYRSRSALALVYGYSGAASIAPSS